MITGAYTLCYHAIPLTDISYHDACTIHKKYVSLHYDKERAPYGISVYIH